MKNEIEVERKEKEVEIVSSNQLDIIKKYIKMVGVGKMEALIIHSKAGLGKTYTILNTLKEAKIDFKYLSGYMTPLGLYRYLYENRDKIIVLDDVEGLLTNEISIAIMKSALWKAGDTRTVCYDSTAKQLGKTPKSFEFTGQIVLLTNEVGANKTSENYKALLSRTTTFELVYTFDQIIAQSKKIIEKRKLTNPQKEKVLEILEKIDSSFTFNFRELDRLIKFVEFDIESAETMFFNSSKANEEVKAYLRIVSKWNSTELQIEMFKRETGLSRRSYYRFKKKYGVPKCQTGFQEVGTKKSPETLKSEGLEPKCQSAKI